MDSKIFLEQFRLTPDGENFGEQVIEALEPIYENFKKAGGSIQEFSELVNWMCDIVSEN